MLSKTMERCPTLSFASYDRMFPAQDFLPKGGLGNLIALPLQNKPRKNGFSIFINDSFVPLEDQWNFLLSIEKISADQIEEVLSVNNFVDVGFNQNISCPAEIKDFAKNIDLPKTKE